MATSDKHCQTFCVTNVTNKLLNEEVNFTKSYNKGMYDETVEVNAKEIESPPSSENENEGVVRSAMAKFTPPQRPARHDFDSDSDSATEGDHFLSNISGEDQSPDRKSLRSQAQPEPSEGPRPRPRSSARRPHSAVSRRALSSNSDEDTDSADLDPEAGPAPLAAKKRSVGVVIPAEGAYDPTQYQDLKVPPEIEACFQYIQKYTPQKIEIDFKLQPFIPDYVPAVGDTDAFLKVTTPACNARAEPLAETILEHVDNLGLTVLDEPSSEQSDSALLHLQLRAVSKTNSTKSTVLTKKIEDAEKNPKSIDRWIKDISELHLSKPAPTVTYTTKMPDIDTLMEEWPEAVERALSQAGIPPATADCTLTEYADLVCALTDVPVAADSLAARLQALHLLFSLYSAVKGSQLYADREKEKENG